MTAYSNCEFINPIKELQIKVFLCQYSEPIREQDCQLLSSLAPVLNRLFPLLSNSRKCKIDKLFQGDIRCKNTLVLGYPAKLAVVAFHCVGGVY